MSTEKTNSKFEQGKKLANDFLSGINKDDILTNAQKVVSSAVNVLEEEIAAGILAAKKIEKKIIDVDDIRSDPSDLMSRIRRDTHEAIDLFLDAFTAITKQVGNLSASIKSENEDKETSDNNTSTDTETAAEPSSPKSSVKKDNGAVLIEPEKPMAPGETISFTLVLSEDSDEETKIDFQKTHLYGPNDQIIYSRAFKVLPDKILLKAKQDEEVTVTLRVPKNALPGKYNAFITDAKSNIVNVVLNVEVTED